MAPRPETLQESRARWVKHFHDLRRCLGDAYARSALATYAASEGCSHGGIREEVEATWPKEQPRRMARR